MRPPAAISVAVLSVLLVLVGPTPAQAASPESRYGSQAVRATNNARDDHGLRELRVNECLKRFAVRQAKRMAEQERMFHQELGPVLRACDLATVGENVAYGYPTGRAVVRKGWMRSEGHRANILDRGFRIVAVGARRSDDGTWYVAQVLGRRAR